MRTFLSIFFLWITTSLYGQNIKELYPKIGKTLDFGSEKQKEWALRSQLREKSWDNLTKEEQKIAGEYETFDSMWNIIGGGCNWYCGAGEATMSASSYLESQGDNTYDPKNAYDLSYKTAWVEGVPGYGIGEYIEYEFTATHPRINKIIVVNGYVKNLAAWKNNSRVRKLKMYIDGKPLYILNLEDVIADQYFEIPPIGYGNRSYEELKNKPNWKIRFEIMDVYKGDKYDDVVLTEIYFDGLDVHCLGKGTKIRMADSTEKTIETLKEGDQVLSYNIDKKIFEPAGILEMTSPYHCDLIRIVFENGISITSTKDHPFFNGKHWISYDPQKTMHHYDFGMVSKLKEGSFAKTLNGYSQVNKIEKLESGEWTYTIVKLDKNNTFIANGFIVGTEELKFEVLNPEK